MRRQKLMVAQSRRRVWHIGLEYYCIAFSRTMDTTDGRHGWCKWRTFASSTPAAEYIARGCRRRVHVVSGCTHARTNVHVLVQDICMVINSDQPVWLTGMLEMTRTLGLELMENALAQYAHVFRRVSTSALLPYNLFIAR